MHRKTKGAENVDFENFQSIHYNINIPIIYTYKSACAIYNNKINTLSICYLYISVHIISEEEKEYFEQKEKTSKYSGFWYI